MNRIGRYNQSSKRLLISILLLVNIFILLISLKIYLVEKKALLHQNEDQLKSIAQIKIDQVVDWRNERLADARYLSVSPQIYESFRLYVRDTSNYEYRRSLFNNLNGMFLNGKYESMIALDIHGNVVFSLPDQDTAISPFIEGIKIKIQKQPTDIQVGDFGMNRDSIPVMQIAIPVIDLASRDSTLYGWFFLNIRLDKTFVPVLETVPVPSKTIGIFLYLKEKNGMLLLNNRNISRHNKNQPDKNRNNFEVSQYRYMRESLGKEHLIGLQNEEVITTCLPVPESGAYLLIKMDKSEAYEEAHRIGFIILALTIAIMISLVSTLLYFWQRQRNEVLSLETDKRLIMQRFDMLSKFANDAIILYTRDMTIIQVNDKALELYGYSRVEFLGLNVELLKRSDLRSFIPVVHEKIMEEGGYRYETIHIRKDGTEFPVEISIRYMEMMDSHCFQGIIRDISQRKQFERALIESESRLRLIANTLPQIVWTARPDGSFDFINSRFETVTGINPEKEGMLREIMHPDDVLRVRKFWQESAQKVREHQIRFRIRMKDGTFRWYLVISTPLCRDDGSIISWYGSATDIDELENTVAQRTAELQDLYNNAPCGYFTMDNQGIIININDTALKWLGYHRDEIVGKISFRDMVARENQEKVADHFKIVFKTGYMNNLDYGMLRKEGTVLPVLLNATAVMDKDGNPSLIRSTIIDHTDRKHHETEILKLNTLLQEHGYNLENTNNELEAFIYSVSHDLRAPLRAINGFTRILLNDYARFLDAEALKILEKVWDNANKMKQLIEDLLRLSRTSRQELSIVPIDMQALFVSLIEEVRQMNPDRTIHAEVLPMPQAYADLALLKQVVSNLLSNAVKFSGKLDVSEIEIGFTENQPDAAYYVKDNGIGFDMKFVHNLFGVFRRLCNTEEYEGTGVGLALVKRIIERHGGKVWAESKSNHGAVFYFSLPDNKNDHKLQL
jgi:PAS domain S-box-containing protein